MSIKKSHLTKLQLLKENRFLMLYDQAFFSLFNFASIFLLSKIANVEVFSAFVIFQSYIFFIFIFCTFLLSAPSLVLLNKYWSNKKESYVSLLLCTNLIVSAILALACYLFLKEQNISISYIYVFSIPFLMSSFDVIKKYFFASFSIKLYHTIISSILLNIVFFIGVYLYQDQLSLNIIVLVYGIAYAIAVGYLGMVLVIKGVFTFKSLQAIKHTNFVKEVLGKHYSYSKWIIIGGIAYWGYSQGLYIFSKELMVSDFGISKVKTSHNILGMVNIFIISIENYYTPYFSKKINENSDQTVRTLVKSLYAKNTVYVLLLMAIVFLFAIFFYNFLYEVKYGNGLLLITLFTLAQLAMFLVRPISIALKSLEITAPFFYAHLIALTSMLSVGYFAIKNYGYTGVALTYFMTIIVFVSVVYYFYSKKVKLTKKSN